MFCCVVCSNISIPFAVSFVIYRRNFLQFGTYSKKQFLMGFCRPPPANGHVWTVSLAPLIFPHTHKIIP